MEINRHHIWVHFKPDTMSIESHTNPYLKVPPSLFKKIHSEWVTIIYGDTHLKVQIFLNKNEPRDNTFFCSNDIFQSIGTDLDQYSAMVCLTTNTLTIGPVIGVLTEVSKNASLIEQTYLFPTIRRFCEELADLCKRNGLVFGVYSIESLRNKKIKSYYYNNQNEWTNEILPPAQTLYNRIHSRKISYSPSFLMLLFEKEKEHISIFNKQFLSKQDLSNLNKYPQLTSYIPEGTILDLDPFFQMITKHSTLFIKPNFGSKGKGIIRIQKKDDSFVLECANEYFYEFSNVQDTWDMLQRKTLHKSYWLQEGISLITIDGHFCDFRVLTHLKADGLWNVTSVIARLSEPGTYITNLSQGGTRLSASVLLQKYFGIERGRQLLDLMKELALETSRLINIEKQGAFIELGVDIGISSDGKVYLLEVNSKPSKDDSENNKTIRPSAKAIGEILYEIGKQNIEEGCTCHHSEF